MHLSQITSSKRGPLSRRWIANGDSSLTAPTEPQQALSASHLVQQADENARRVAQDARLQLLQLLLQHDALVPEAADLGLVLVGLDAEVVDGPAQLGTLRRTRAQSHRQPQLRPRSNQEHRSPAADAGSVT